LLLLAQHCSRLADHTVAVPAAVTTCAPSSPPSVCRRVQQGQPPPNAAYGAGSYAASTNDGAPPPDATRIVSLLEAVTVAELADPKEYDEILEDMRDECSKYGQARSLWGLA